MSGWVCSEGRAERRVSRRTQNGHLRLVFTGLDRKRLIVFPGDISARGTRLFHNLRASCQTDPEQRFPSYVVCTWMGNSESVAKAHDLQVLPQHFEAALKDDAHSDARLAGMGLNSAESHALLARLAMVWPRLTDSDRAAVVEVAERMAIASSEGPGGARAPHRVQKRAGDLAPMAAQNPTQRGP